MLQSAVSTSMIQRTLLVLALAIAATPAAAQAPIEPLLTGEPTPGSMALLVHHVLRPEAQSRLADGLRHARADVRAAAARVIHVVGARGLVPSLAVALAAEREADPALEMGRALAALGGPSHDGGVFASWARVPAGHVSRVALGFAGVRGPAALAGLPRLRAADAGGAALTAYLVAARPPADGLDGIVASAVVEDDDTAFGAALDAARELAIAIDDSRLVAALDPARSPAMRLTAARSVFRGWSTRRAPAPTVLAALGADGPFGTETTAIESRLAREFANRVAGRAATNTPEWRALLEDPSPAVVGFVLLRGVERLLTNDERRWLRQLLPQRGDGDAPEPSTTSATHAAIQLLDGFPQGYVLSVLAVAGCDLGRAKKTGLGASAGQTTLHTDGRASRASRIDTGITQAACTLATDVLLMTSIVRAPQPVAGAQAIAVLPFETGYLECSDRQAQDVVGAGLGAGSRLEPPKKIRHVNPIYPQAALDARIHGTVLVQATIGTQGCPGRLRIVSSVDPRLDLSALLAVTGWRFAPTRIDGTAVPVELMVTVQFTLR